MVRVGIGILCTMVIEGSWQSGVWIKTWRKWGVGPQRSEGKNIPSRGDSKCRGSEQEYALLGWGAVRSLEQTGNRERCRRQRAVRSSWPCRLGWRLDFTLREVGRCWRVLRRGGTWSGGCFKSSTLAAVLRVSSRGKEERQGDQSSGFCGNPGERRRWLEVVRNGWIWIHFEGRVDGICLWIGWRVWGKERTQRCQGLAQATGRTELSFTEMRKKVGGNQELDFGHIRFEMPIQVEIQV